MAGRFQIFLSHSQEDHQLVSRIWDILSCMKMATYMHELYPDYRQDLATGIRDVLHDCSICIAFLTQKGINSQWVQQELGIAYAYGKIIVPVNETGVEYKGFVQMIRRIDYLPGDPDEMIYNVIYAMRNHVIHNFDAIPNGLTLTCPNGHKHDYQLPSNNDINDAIIAQTLFAHICLTCNVEIPFTPKTLEVTSQTNFGNF
jgi:TIR domain